MGSYGGAGLANYALEKAAAFMERLLAQVTIIDCEQVEGYERGGRLFCEQPHPALSGVHPLR
jgi:hypothetical protein